MVLISYTYNPTNAGYCEINVKLDAMLTNGLVRAHSKHDVAIVKLGAMSGEGESSSVKFNTNWLRGVSVNGGKPRPISGSALRLLANVKVGDDAYILGYPSSIGLRQSPKFDYSKPLLRKGIIAGVYEKEQTIIVDSSVY